MLELRRASPDDPDARALTDEVQRYYVEIYGGPDDDPLDPARFVPPRGGFLLGYVAGRAVAMGGWTRRADRPGDAQLRRMYVRPADRRRGFAAALLDALENDARAAGAERTVLTTGEPQHEAIGFYRAHGYDDIEPFGHYADVPTAVHLGRRLS